jgi:hypothetical protein
MILPNTYLSPGNFGRLDWARRRITERGEAARRVVLERHGVKDVAVELLREAREEDCWIWVPMQIPCSLPRLTKWVNCG